MPEADPAVGARLGLAVSKKQARRAVDRNRLKRVIREQFRRRRTALPPLSLVVMIRSSAAKASNLELSDALAVLFERIASQDGKRSGA